MLDLNTLSDKEVMRLDTPPPTLQLDTVTPEEEAYLRIPFQDRLENKDYPHGGR